MFRRMTSSGTWTYGYISSGDVMGIWLTNELVTAMNYMVYISVPSGISGAGDVSGEWMDTHYYNNQHGIALVPETLASQYSVDDRMLKAAAADMCYKLENGDAYSFNGTYNYGNAAHPGYYFQVVHVRQSIPAPEPPLPNDERRKREWYAIYHSPCFCPYIDFTRVGSLFCGVMMYVNSVPLPTVGVENGTAESYFRAIETIWHKDGFVSPQNGAWTRYLSLSDGYTPSSAIAYYRLPPRLKTTSQPYHLLLYNEDDYPVAAWPSYTSPWNPNYIVTNTVSYGFKITGTRAYALVYDWMNESYS